MVSNAVGSNGDGAEDSGTPDGTQQVRNALERRWRDVDPNEIANAMLRPQLGAAGEWDPPEGVEPKRPVPSENLIRHRIAPPYANFRMEL
jgi:hypothetical protein